MTQRAEQSAPGFSVAQARHIIADLFAPKPWIFWTDFLLAFAVGMVGLNICLAAVRDWPTFLPAQSLAVRLLIPGVAFFATGLLFYRM